MDYRAFKKQMGEQDASYKYMSDTEMGAKYDEYLKSRQGSQSKMNETKEKNSAVSVQACSSSPDPSAVVVTDINMPFGSMVKFMVKWSLASIPAFIILFVIFSIVFAIFSGVIAGVSQRY